MILAMPDASEVETTHRGRLFSVEVHRQSLPDGGEVVREIVRHPGAVLIVPVLPNGDLVMIRNYRIAPDERLWEFPAGKLEPDEEPRDAALRELKEETGYEAGRIRAMCEFFTSPGFADELMRVFVAENLRQNEQRLEPGEDIEVEVITHEEAISMALDGRMRDGKTIAALLAWHVGETSRHPNVETSK